MTEKTETKKPASRKGGCEAQLDDLRQELAETARKLAERDAELDKALENYIKAVAEAQALRDDLDKAREEAREIGRYWEQDREALRRQKAKAATLAAMICGAVAAVAEGENAE